MCASIYIFTSFLNISTLSCFLKHLAAYPFMFAGWRFRCTLIGYLVPLCILMNSNGYGNLSSPTLLIEKVARLLDARPLQFPFVGDVLSLWYDLYHVISQPWPHCQPARSATSDHRHSNISIQLRHKQVRIQLYIILSRCCCKYIYMLWRLFCVWKENNQMWFVPWISGINR